MLIYIYIYIYSTGYKHRHLPRNSCNSFLGISDLVPQRQRIAGLSSKTRKMESGGFLFDPSLCSGSMLFLGSGDNTLLPGVTGSVSLWEDDWKLVSRQISLSFSLSIWQETLMHRMSPEFQKQLSLWVLVVLFRCKISGKHGGILEKTALFQLVRGTLWWILRWADAREETTPHYRAGPTQSLLHIVLFAPAHIYLFHLLPYIPLVVPCHVRII